MPYVRQHGNQLAIVHGERDSETGKVVQRNLATLYSRAEAQEAIGKGDAVNANRFQRSLERRLPGIRFDWKKLGRQIEKKLDLLPADYPYRESRLLRGGFHEHLTNFVRELARADPQSTESAADLIREHRHALEFLTRLVEFRLKCCDGKPSEWTADNRFYWRFELHDQRVPADAWGIATECYDRRELDRAEAVFKFLLGSFPEDARIHNYLGHIALDRREASAAVEHFTLAVKLGRRFFPKRISRDRWWGDDDTRPYLRGLCNLAEALNVSGHWDDALQTCDRIDREWNDNHGATAALRSAILLNSGQYEGAAREALRVNRIWSRHSFIAAFAFLEIGKADEALTWFLHGALNGPQTARMLIGTKRPPVPRGYLEVKDHNDGVMTMQEIAAYLDRQPPKLRRFFRVVLKIPQVAGMLQEIEHVCRRWTHQHQKGCREAFDRMNEMREITYAQERARELIHGIDPPC